MLQDYRKDNHVPDYMFVGKDIHQYFDFPIHHKMRVASDYQKHWINWNSSRNLLPKLSILRILMGKVPNGVRLQSVKNRHSVNLFPTNNGL